MSGLRRRSRPRLTGPRLLNEAMLSPASVAPTLNATSYMAGGSWTCCRRGPSCPAATTGQDAGGALGLDRRLEGVPASSPPPGGQSQELLVTSGAGGVALAGVPPTG